MVSVSPGLDLQVVDSFDRAPSAEEWNGLLQSAASNVIFLTKQWQEIWWNNAAAQSSCKLCILVLRAEEGALVGVAPLFIERTPLPPLQEYAPGVQRPEHGEGEPLRIVRFVGGVEVADYLDVIASASRLREVWSAVLDYLNMCRQTWDAIDLHSLPEFSPSRDILAELAPEKGLYAEIFPEDVAPVIELPGDWDTYLMSLRKKDRHELKRKVRKLEGREDARWYLVDPTDSEALREGMQSFIHLVRASDPDKARFMDEARAASFMDMAERLAPTGWLELAILDLNHEPAAAYLSYKYADSIYLYNSGYDPRYRAYSAGVALLAYRIHKAIRQGVKVFDFLRGDEDYKYDFGGKNRYVYRAVLRPNEAA